MLLRDAVTRQRGTVTTGPHGEPVTDWSTPAEGAYAAEVFSPTSDEDVDNAQRVDAQYVVQAYPDADVTSTDRVVWQGDMFEVVSGVDKLSAHGRVRSLKFLIRRITGA